MVGGGRRRVPVIFELSSLLLIMYAVLIVYLFAMEGFLLLSG